MQPEWPFRTNSRLLGFLKYMVLLELLFLAPAEIMAARDGHWSVPKTLTAICVSARQSH